MTPLTVKQIGRPSYYREMVRDCADRIRLSGQETALLYYYADCGTGYCPSLKIINKWTGIKLNKIWHVRKSLIDRNLLIVTGREISPAWSHIRALAMIPRMSKHMAKTGRWGGAKRRRQQKLSELAKGYRDPDALRIQYPTPHQLSESEERFASLLGDMTEEEFNDWLSIPMPRPKTDVSKAA